MREVLVELEVLLDEFGTINFQHGKQNDLRIIRLLDNASFGSSRTITPELAAITVEKIRDQYKTFRLWYFSLLHKVRIMVRRAGNLLEYDLIDAANDIVDFYNGFIESAAEETVNLINKGEPVDLFAARQILKSFTINMSELRGRGNTLLKKMRQQGYTISGMELKPFREDLVMEMNNPPEALPEESGTSPLKA